jgi:SAM-dependent methyltransferase
MMNIQTKRDEFINELKKSINNNTFGKLSLSGYIGVESELKNLYIKLIEIKNTLRLNFVYRYKTKDVTKNYDFSEAYELIQRKIGDEFKIATILSLENDIVFEKTSNDDARIRYNKASLTKLPNLFHDKKKTRKIDVNSEKRYLHLLGIIDETGKVKPKSQDKFKQINNYIELISPSLEIFNDSKQLKIADMGSGKGYLTFALYDYLMNHKKVNSKITGIEIRKELVELCNTYAEECSFNGLSFVEGSIDNSEVDGIDMLIALHACDTATDDAILKGIENDSKLIVVAPCCQHQIRQSIDKKKSDTKVKPLLKYGIFMERQSELLTDTLRCLYLEYFGYKVKVVEFIADAHTHKNIMIIAEKKDKDSKNNSILNQIERLKEIFGIEKHYLDKILD